MTDVHAPGVKSLPQIRVLSEDFWQDIHGNLAEAREASAVGITDTGLKMVLRRNEAESVLRDPQRFRQVNRAQAYAKTESGAIAVHWRHIMANMNPPDHTRLRGLVVKAFTPRRMESLRPLVNEWANSLLSQAMESGEIEVTGSFSQLPMRVISHLLGVPEADQAWFAGRAKEFGKLFYLVMDDESLAAVNSATADLQAYADTMISDRLQNPRGDFLSDLVAVQEGTDRLTRDELVNLIVLLLWAGVDTTSASIPIVLATLAKHPEQAQYLRDHPEQIPPALDEIMRFETPIFATLRQCAEDTVLDGVTISQGEMVQVNLASAARDPEGCDDADTLRLDRPNPRVMTFGSGIHHCLGASLARVQLQEIVRVVLGNTKSLDLVNDPKWVPYTVARRLDSVRMSFT